VGFITNLEDKVLENLKSYAHPVGRVLLGLLFLMAGFGKITTMGAANFGAYIDSVTPGLGILAWPIMVFELLAGIALIIGFKVRPVALALALFCVFTGVVFHGFAPAEMTNTLKNLALAGGYLMLFAHGAGKWAIDK